ncbi:MAG: hypothetical protein RKR03_10065 [Candidatus Competibacter sp.]|nr:hypothetical protein [Candidatus Competibacter sp.]
MNLSILLKYFWLIPIIVTGINGAIFWKRAQKHINENPELKEGYEKLFHGYLVWINIPWVVMGIGCTIGGIPSVEYYLRPQDGNPYVLLWFATLFLLIVFASFWLFFRDGADKLVRYPVFMAFAGGSKNITNPALIKIFWLFGLACMVIAIIVVYIFH